MEVKDVLIMKWGLGIDNKLIKKQKIKFPKVTPLMSNNFNNDPLGTGHNFRTTDEGIICDISIPFELNTIASGLKILKSKKKGDIRIVQKAELIELSFVSHNVDKTLDNNFDKKHREQRPHLVMSYIEDKS